MPAVGNPCGDTNKQIWHRWSLERAERDRQERLRRQADRQAASEWTVYPIEMARDVAQAHGNVFNVCFKALK